MALQKDTKIRIAAAIILLVLIGLYAYSHKADPRAATLEQVPSSIASSTTPGWNTYHDAIMGFSMQYPASYGTIFVGTPREGGIREIAIGKDDPDRPGSKSVRIIVTLGIYRNAETGIVETVTQHLPNADKVVLVGNRQGAYYFSKQVGHLISVPMDDGKIMDFEGIDPADSVGQQILASIRFDR